jgi:hypothetical protein
LNTCFSIAWFVVVTLTSTTFTSIMTICVYHKFSMKHLLHLIKLWTIYHFMSIQTTNVACIWRCLLWFLIWLYYLCGCHYGFFFLLFACLHTMIHHPTICAIFVSLPYITLCFCWCYLFSTLWY